MGNISCHIGLRESRAEQNSTMYNILLTGMSCIVHIDKVTEWYYKDSDNIKYCKTDVYFVATQLTVFTSWPLLLQSPHAKHILIQDQ